MKIVDPATGATTYTRTVSASTGQGAARSRRRRVETVVRAVLVANGGAASPRAVEAACDDANFSCGEVQKAFTALRLEAVTVRGRVVWRLPR